MFPLSLLLLTIPLTSSSMLTFEIEDGMIQCFYRKATSGNHYSLEIQVLSGEGYDISFQLYAPNGDLVKNYPRISFETFELDDVVDGDYKACFDNSYSSMMHKTVFFGWFNSSELNGDENVFNGPDAVLLSIGMNISMNLNRAAGYQIRERLLHTVSYKFGEQLNTRVMYWSLGQGVFVILVALCQVYMLRSMFKTPTTRHAPVPTRQAMATGF